MPEISIIVPVYNVEQYLPAALDSLRAQTCPDWEAILVDDGSPDGCGALCDAAARQDARFRVIHQKNAGVGAARNAGLAAARGTYVQDRSLLHHESRPGAEIKPRPAVNFRCRVVFLLLATRLNGRSRAQTLMVKT